MGDRRHAPWWIPYVGFAIIVGGWLVQYGMERKEHETLQNTVKKLEAESEVSIFINYREHPHYSDNLLAAQLTK